ncbi:hypothetical protein ABH158_05615, partial [Bacteroides ovatus]
MQKNLERKNSLFFPTSAPIHLCHLHTYIKIILHTISPSNSAPAWPPGLVFPTSSAGGFSGVKKGRLFERSEFLPFSRRKHRSSRKNAALILSFWFLFFRIKTKEKELILPLYQKLLLVLLFVISQTLKIEANEKRFENRSYHS